MTPTTEQHTWFARARELALTLTAWPSVTGSAGETAFAKRLRGLLLEWPAFRDHPADVWLTPARQGHSAWNVYALVRGASSRTVLLSGHYDTVRTDDYGAWQPLAGEVEALTRGLLSAWQDQGPAGLTHSERLAAGDLASGDFLMGRGLLDMKGGIAAGLAVLERYAALPLHERPGTLMLVASPDEEGRSSGARAVTHDLPQLARTRGLDIVAGINLDATADLGDGEEGRAVYLGSVGKLLVSALVVGQPTHAASPFGGVSAALLASALVTSIEAAPELAEAGHHGAPEWSDPERPDSELADDPPAPPVCLELRDGKTEYDVTTPAQVWCAFNVLTQRRTAAAVLELFVTRAREVMGDALADFARRAARSGYLHAPDLSALRAEVLTFGELRERAERRAGQEAVQSVIRGASAGSDPLRQSREITSRLVTLAHLNGPAVVLGFGALHYPAVHLGESPGDHLLHGAAARHAAELARETGQSLKLRRYFAGISDMSFLGRPGTPDDAHLAQHTPHPDHVDPAPQDALSFGVVNIGPWGRDYHQRLERVHAPYAFGVVPELIWRVTQTVLKARSDPEQP